ncbi:MAG TPA: class I SAM-dependent methyltransferase [Kofleriaceae bacterium]|jgi:SAM-dependent methyltransferase
METVDCCNLCGSSRHSPFAEVIGPVSGRALHVVTCDGCGLRFLSPRLLESEVAALYDEEYFNGRGFDPSINYVDEDEERAVRGEETRGVIEKIELFKPDKAARVLDVGCGTGGLLTGLARAGYTDLWGVELSDYAARLAGERSGARVSAGDVVGADLPKNTFDAINATEVIEHLRDPRAFFARVYELLAPGGVFLYTTGNARGAYARMLGKRWPYLIDGHLFYFDPTTLARYFTEAGLESVDARQLERDVRRGLMRAEGRVAVGVLQLVGRSDRGLKGRIFRWVAALDSPVTRYALIRVLGKDKMPLAFKRA